jgi:hypothetical protein
VYFQSRFRLFQQALAFPHPERVEGALEAAVGLQGHLRPDSTLALSDSRSTSRVISSKPPQKAHGVLLPGVAVEVEA